MKPFRKSGSTTRALLALTLLATLGASSARAGEEAERFRAEYLRILGSWSAAPSEAVVTALGELEEGALGQAAELRRAQESVAGELAAVDAGAVPPVAHLHLLAYARYLERGDDALADFAAERFWELLRRYLARATEPAAPAVAAELWNRLAFFALTHPQIPPGSAGRLFRRSLEIDPENVAALHGLAFCEERLADWKDAVRYLGRLLELEPTNGEARLRHARARVHAGGRARGAEELAELIASEAPDWVRILAYQELAGLERQSGRDEEAAALLRRGVEELPDNERLQLLLAYASRGRWAESTARVEELVAGWTEDAGPSPRARYDMGPVDEIEANREAVERQLIRRLPALHAALDRLDAAGE